MRKTHLRKQAQRNKLKRPKCTLAMASSVREFDDVLRGAIHRRVAAAMERAPTTPGGRVKVVVRVCDVMDAYVRRKQETRPEVTACDVARQLLRECEVPNGIELALVVYSNWSETTVSRDQPPGGSLLNYWQMGNTSVELHRVRSYEEAVTMAGDDESKTLRAVRTSLSNISLSEAKAVDAASRREQAGPFDVVWAALAPATHQSPACVCVSSSANMVFQIKSDVVLRGLAADGEAVLVQQLVACGDTGGDKHTPDAFVSWFDSTVKQSVRNEFGLAGLGFQKCVGQCKLVNGEDKEVLSGFLDREKTYRVDTVWMRCYRR